MRAGALSTMLVAVTTACNPVYAPPVRGTHYGAPGRLSGRRVEIGAAAGGPSSPSVGGPHIGLGLEDWVSIEGGANLDLVGDRGWAMGWLGARFTRAPVRSLDWVGDVELGGGAGVGGIDCRNDPCTTWFETPAGGGYAGLGFGVYSDPATIYLRSRVEVTAARGIPVTFWPSALFGLDFTLERTVALGFAGGYLGIGNEHQWLHGFIYQVQLSLLFDAPR